MASVSDKLWSDIQQNKISSQNTQGYIHNLIVTVEAQLFPKAVPKVLEHPLAKNISVQNKSALIRMYKLENQKG